MCDQHTGESSNRKNSLEYHARWRTRVSAKSQADMACDAEKPRAPSSISCRHKDFRKLNLGTAGGRRACNRLGPVPHCVTPTPPPRR